MACLEFADSTAKGLVVQMLQFLTNPLNFGAGFEWELVYPSTIANFVNTEECILKGKGDSSDEIYVGIQVTYSNNGTQSNIRFNGFAGYDPGLKWHEQPGCIYHSTLPIMPLVENSYMTCWLSANSRRFILVVQLSTQYESAYIGFMQPVSIERQYPYPLVIGASHIDGGSWADSGKTHSMWTNPGGTFPNTTLRLRRSDGVWTSSDNTEDRISGHLLVWPQNVQPTNVLTVLDDNLTIENIIMFPMLLYETGLGTSDPAGILGQLDGVYFVGNREDLSSKDTLIYNGRPYMVFNNVFRRDNDQYFAIEWF